MRENISKDFFQSQFIPQARETGQGMKRMKRMIKIHGNRNFIQLQLHSRCGSSALRI